jgi:nucleotide-binding universal stress UspA family protein
MWRIMLCRVLRRRQVSYPKAPSWFNLTTSPPEFLIQEKVELKRLMITIDGSPNDAASLESAIMVARRLTAKLNVVFTVSPKTTFYTPPDIAASPSIDDSEEKAIEMERALSAFNAVCGDWPGAEWSTTEASSSEVIRNLGPLLDLVIMERLSEEEGPSGASLNAALFEGAGPVLITPPVPPKTFATKPVIAWNTSRQSALAVKSAMAILQFVDRVTVLSGDTVSSDSFGELKKYLSAYGIEMTVERYSSGQLSARARARALLQAVDDLSADLLVMGAYGENAMSALFGLGRATRKIVTAARVPVMLRHYTS